MAGLFLGRGSACNWCDESSSPSESDPSISESSISVSSISSVSEIETLVCTHCLAGTAPRKFRVSLPAYTGSDPCFAANYTGIKYVEFNYGDPDILLPPHCRWGSVNEKPLVNTLDLCEERLTGNQSRIRVAIYFNGTRTQVRVFFDFESFAPLSDFSREYIGRVNCLEAITIPSTSHEWTGDCVLTAAA